MSDDILDFTTELDAMPDRLLNELRIESAAIAEDLAGRARELTPTDSGLLKESIVSFTQQEEEGVAAGAKTNSEYAPFVEFGTGPTGEAVGHPLDGELGIVRKQEKWKVNIPDVGVRWIAGQAPQPFLYPAMQEQEDTIMDAFGAVIKEVATFHD